MQYIIADGKNGDYLVIVPGTERQYTYSLPDLAALIAECLPTKEMVHEARFAYASSVKGANALNEEKIKLLEREVELYLVARACKLPVQDIRVEKRKRKITGYNGEPLEEKLIAKLRRHGCDV